ncbi:MAG: KEOPS complex kinase/ATPase Bud32, partial [Nanoarchaeota archaeon]
KMQIRMAYLDGHLVRDILDQKTPAEQKVLLREIGRIVGLFHSKDVIHGDLTTSNIILQEGKVFFIDFGLGFISLKSEDKAVDLHVFRQALESKHYQHADRCYPWFLEGYRQWKGSADVLTRLEKVEARGRYKRKTTSSSAERF